MSVPALAVCGNREPALLADAGFGRRNISPLDPKGLGYTVLYIKKTSNQITNLTQE